MKKVRFAVVGVGWIAQEGFLPAAAQTGNSEVTAMVTGKKSIAERLAQFYAVPHVFHYEQFDNALALGLFDAVYISLPNSLHADFAIRALKMGVHVLVEKPMAINVAECEAMIAAAKSGGALLMTAYRLHCEPGTVEAIRLVRDGAIGCPRFFSAIFSAQAGVNNHRLKPDHWGGPLQDIGSYCLNAARHLFGAEPVQAVAIQGHGEDPRFSEVPESVSAILRFPGDQIASFTVSFNAADVDSYRIVGTRGEIEMRPGFRFETPTRMIWRRDGEQRETTFPHIDHFGAQTAYFADCILTGTSPEPDGEEGLADVRALLAIEVAARTGIAQPILSSPRPGHPSSDMVRLVERTSRRLVL